jgi:hypothetical protein
MRHSSFHATVQRVGWKMKMENFCMGNERLVDFFLACRTTSLNHANERLLDRRNLTIVA